VSPLKLSNPFRRSADRPSLKQQAAALRTTAAKVMGRSAPPAPSTPLPSVGGDAELAILATLLCDAFAQHDLVCQEPDPSDADMRASWAPVRAVIERMSVVEASTVQGLALKCLGLAADRVCELRADPTGEEAGDRIVRQFQDAVRAGSLAPLSGSNETRA
jgi:hypothetical protein